VCAPFWQARFYDFNVWTDHKRVEKLNYMHHNPEEMWGQTGRTPVSSRAMLLYHSVMPLGLHRYYGADHLHFITCSCYRRTPLLRTAGSRDRFLSILEQTRQRYRFVVVGYVIMPEHSSSAQ
jgi:REP element-mobilizing transposase RayT